MAKIDEKTRQFIEAMRELILMYDLAYQSPCGVNWDDVMTRLTSTFGSIEKVERMINNFKLLHEEMEKITNNINSLRLLLENLAKNIGESVRKFWEAYKTTLDWWNNNREIIEKAFMIIVAKKIITESHKQKP